MFASAPSASLEIATDTVRTAGFKATVVDQISSQRRTAC
jgi:hypothetical protein